MNAIIRGLVDALQQTNGTLEQINRSAAPYLIQIREELSKLGWDQFSTQEQLLHEALSPKRYPIREWSIVFNYISDSKFRGKIRAQEEQEKKRIMDAVRTPLQAIFPNDLITLVCGNLKGIEGYVNLAEIMAIEANLARARAALEWAPKPNAEACESRYDQFIKLI